jgi:hypothetical protein
MTPYHRRTCPFHHLSKGVLREIFSALFAESDNISGLIISSVCRNWREVALGMPNIWTNISLRAARHPRILEQILSRSIHNHIDVRIDFNQQFFSTCDAEAPDFRDTFEAIVVHIKRLRRLTITARNPIIHAIVKHLKNRTMPKLEHLELIQCDTGPVSFFGPFSVNSDAFTSLRLVRTAATFGDASLLRGLRTLDLVESSGRFLDQSAHIDYNFPAGPPLSWVFKPSRLSITDTELFVNANNPLVSIKPAFIVSRLTHLTLSRIKVASSPDSMAAFIRLFNMTYNSGLEELCLDNIHDQALEILQQMIGAPYPKYSRLRSLTLSSLPIRDLRKEFYLAFPAVETLTLHDVDPSSLLVSKTRDPHILPLLKYITFNGVRLRVGDEV